MRSHWRTWISGSWYRVEPTCMSTRVQKAASINGALLQYPAELVSVSWLTLSTLFEREWEWKSKARPTSWWRELSRIATDPLLLDVPAGWMLMDRPRNPQLRSMAFGPCHSVPFQRLSTKLSWFVGTSHPFEWTKSQVSEHFYFAWWSHALLTPIQPQPEHFVHIARFW